MSGTAVGDLRRAGAEEKAHVLAEAMPYIREFSGKTVVIKYGGHAMESAELADQLAQDVVLMRLVGMNPVVVHGGGPQITELMRRLGQDVDVRRRPAGHRRRDRRHRAHGAGRQGQPRGRRRRSTSTVRTRSGSRARTPGLIAVTQRDERLGFVGDVASIDPSILHRLLREELIPVVATIGMDDTGQAYNVNADTVAGAIAESLGAEKLVYLTDVAGVYRDFPDESSLISQIDADGLEQLVADGRAGEGMIPKLASCVHALRNGVTRAHILDGRIPHALLLEFFTREGIGTMVGDEL